MPPTPAPAPHTGDEPGPLWARLLGDLGYVLFPVVILVILSSFL